jgi:hypothetical protein
MMKRLLLIPVVFVLATSVYAVTATPSGNKLENLKDRLASAASTLQQSQKRAIFGTVKLTSVSTITVETATKDVKIELTDEIKVAQMIKGKRTDLTTDDLSKGDVVTVFGDYDSTLDLLKAKVIFIEGTIPERIYGTVSDTDKKNYTITITTSDGKSIIVDIETITKNILWDKGSGTSKGAFSKYTAGDTVFVLETPEPKFDNRVSALRVLDIGNLTGVKPTQPPTLTPTKVASPSATVKVTPKPTQ